MKKVAWACLYRVCTNRTAIRLSGTLIAPLEESSGRLACSQEHYQSSISTEESNLSSLACRAVYKRANWIQLLTTSCSLALHAASTRYLSCYTLRLYCSKPHVLAVCTCPTARRSVVLSNWNSEYWQACPGPYRAAYRFRALCLITWGKMTSAHCTAKLGNTLLSQRSPQRPNTH